ncbi:MAG: hypothetical protein ACTSVE_09890 [Candidatus Helarchaeota archaeon]
MLILILKNKDDKEEEISNPKIISECMLTIEKIGDFLFDMLKLKKKFVANSIEILESDLKENQELTLKLKNKHSSDLKIKHDILELTIPKEHVTHLLKNGILMYITERTVRHPIIEAPSWVKGLREERYIMFNLTENFIEERDPETQRPSIIFKVAKKEDVLYNFLYAVSRGILIIMKYPIE